MNPFTNTSLTVRILTIIFCTMMFIPGMFAQQSNDSLKSKHLYRPVSVRQQDTLIGAEVPDSLEQQHIDSINARLEFVRDSIEARMQFIRDSIAARERFVRDSLRRRKEILDSLNFLKLRLPRLLEASIKTISEQVIIDQGGIDIVGDSSLSDYELVVLPFTNNQPYVPWKMKVNLSDKPVQMNIDTVNKKILSIRSPVFEHSYDYSAGSQKLVINEKAVIRQKRQESFFILPVDTVFFDGQGRLVQIKRYNRFFSATASYHRGAPLFVHLSRVKQYVYNGDGQMKSYRIVNFCDRRSASDEHKVCNIIDYTLEKDGNTWILSREHDPVNQYSSGTYTYEFDEGDILKSIAFQNVKKTENWKTFIEVNEEGYVSRYIYQTDGSVSKTLLVNYYPAAVSKGTRVETITCIFEDDRVCYYQKNNATGKSRVRDKLTLEWGPWK